jgi:hypothetical protein
LGIGIAVNWNVAGGICVDIGMGAMLAAENDTAAPAVAADDDDDDEAPADGGRGGFADPNEANMLAPPKPPPAAAPGAPYAIGADLSPNVKGDGRGAATAGSAKVRYDGIVMVGAGATAASATGGAAKAAEVGDRVNTGRPP